MTPLTTPVLALFNRPQRSSARLSDARLLQRFRTHGDEESFAELVHRHGKWVFGVCRRILQHQQDAEDAVQATFLVMLRKASQLQQAPLLNNWLFGVATRTSLELRTMRERRRVKESRAPLLNETLPDADCKEYLKWLDEEIARLPEHYRFPVILCELQGVRRQAAATQLAIAPGTLSSRLAGARKILAAKLSRRGVTLSATLLSALLAQAAEVHLPPALQQQLNQMPIHGMASSQALVLADSMMKSLFLHKLVSVAGVILLTTTMLASMWMLPSTSQAGPPASGPSIVVMSKEEPMPCTLAGQVVNSEGQPIAAAKLTVRTFAQQKQWTTSTDAHGQYRFGPIPAGHMNSRQLLCSAPGYGLQASDLTVLYAGEQRINDMVMQPGHALTGRILQQDGSPLSGAKVTVQLIRYVLGHSHTDLGEPMTIETDDHGVYRSQALPAGEAHLTIKQAGCVTETRRATITPGRGDVQYADIQLKPDRPISVWVKNDIGQPVAGASISGLVGLDCDSSSADGRIVIRGFLQFPPVLLKVSARGYPQQDLVIQGTESHVKLTKPLYLIGKAVDWDTGELVLINEVSLCQLQKQPDGTVIRTGCGIAGFEQDNPGHFRIPYAILPEKSFAGYHITLSCQGFENGHLNVTPLNDAKDVGDLVIQVKRTGQAVPAGSDQGLKGKVLHQGKPVAHGWMTLNKHHGQRNAPNAAMMHGRTTECEMSPYHHAEIKQGTFRCEALEPGHYAVMLYVPRQAPTYISQVNLTKGAWTEQDFVIAPGCSIAGSVPKVPVVLKNELWAIAFSRQGYRKAVRVQQDGSFVLSDLPAGEYGLKVGCEAFRDKESDVEHPGLLPQGKQLSKADYEAKVKAYEAPADPWKRAWTEKVKPGQAIRDVVLNLPEELVSIVK